MRALLLLTLLACGRVGYDELEAPLSLDAARADAAPADAATIDGRSPPEPAGTDGAVADAGLDDPASCVENCGGFGGSCYCDAACEKYGDCCADFVAVCGGI